MKIAYFTDIFLPAINGVVTSLINLSTALAKEGYTVTIFAPRPARGKKLVWQERNVALEFLPSIPAVLYPDFRLAPPITLRLIEKIRKINPDVIHFQTSFAVGGGGILLGKMLKKPIVGTFHGYFMESEYLQVVGIKNRAKILTNILWKYAVFFFNQCDIVTVPAQTTMQDLKKHGVKKPIIVIPNSINEKGVKLVDKKTVEKLRKNLKLKKKVVLYVGRLSREKNLDVLIKSFSLLIQSLPQTSLLIIGDGPIKQELVELCKKLKVQKLVVFTGEINQEELLTKGYYQIADVFATASTSEVQPVSLLEAMYFGVPIVGVAKRGVEELLQDVGLLSAPQNRKEFAKNLQRVLEDDKLAKQLKKNSKTEFNKNYSLSKVVSQYKHLYQTFF